MNVGNQTNVAGVDWDRSYAATNTELSVTMPVYQITFTNGAHVTAFDGAIIGYQLPDAYANIDAPRVDPKEFFGTVNKHWRDLARNFEDVLKDNFGFTQDIFSNSVAVTAWGYADAPLGQETFTPIMVTWLPYVDPSSPGYETTLAAIRKSERGPRFGVEFDLQSGQIKSFGVFHARLVELFSRRQKDQK